MKNEPVRILLLGKTGVGKSAFINYFIGQNVAESASGMPVTQEMNEYATAIGNFPISIYDTKGIETLDADMQVNELIKEIKKRNNSDNVFEWFHTIFYCVSMANARFEDFEIKFIKRLSKEISQHVHIILTYCDCDACSESAVDEMKQKIKSDLSGNEQIKVYEVVSVEKKKRNGTVVSPRGKEKIADGVFELLWDDISRKIASEYAAEYNRSINDAIDKFFKALDHFIDDIVKIEMLMQIFTDENDKIISQKVEDLEDEIDRISQEEDNKYQKIIRPLLEFVSAYKGIVIDDANKYADLVFDSIFPENMINDILNEEGSIEKLFPRMSKHEKNGTLDELGDEDSILKQILGLNKVILDFATDILGCKRRMKKVIKECKAKTKAQIPSESDVRDHVYNETKKLLDSLT